MASHGFLAKTTTPYIASKTFPTGQAIGLDDFSPATNGKCLNIDLNITRIHLTKYKDMFSMLPRAPPDVSRKQKQSHTDVWDNQLAHGCTYWPEMEKRLHSNAVYRKYKDRLRERGNVSRFQMVVIQAPEAVQLSGAWYPWVT